MSATISGDGMYRYWLSRGAPKSDRTVVFVGVNPSTADATEDDQTIRKMCGFARRWHFDRVGVVNLFALRGAHVCVLDTEDDPVGPENDMHIRAALAEAAMVVPCWGRLSKLPLRLQFRAGEVQNIILCSLNRPARRCLGFTKGGDPMHPLMVAYSTSLVPWP